MEDIYKLIDDINLKNENLDSRVNEAITTDNDDALFILGETLYNFGLMPQGLEYSACYIKNIQTKVNC